MVACNLRHEYPFCQSAENSIEHFATCCKIIELFAAFRLQLVNLEQFLVLDKDSFPRQTVQRTLLFSAVYAARNSMVHDPRLTSSMVLRLSANAVLLHR